MSLDGETNKNKQKEAGIEKLSWRKEGKHLGTRLVSLNQLFKADSHKRRLMRSAVAEVCSAEI